MADVNFQLTEVKEGPVTFKITDFGQNSQTSPKILSKKSMAVFYNPAQAFNRELSIILLHCWEQIEGNIASLIEPLCGSGIRTLRYLLQGPEINTIVCNDINPTAIDLTKMNIEFYNSLDSRRVIYYNMDASRLLARMYSIGQWFDVVDIDPYGSPQPFLRESIRILRNPGLLLITATDMPVWVGLYRERAYKRYGIVNLRMNNRSYCHEIALRALISYVQREFLGFGYLVFPLLSISVDHYLRVAFKRSSGESKTILAQTGYIIECGTCFHRAAVPISQFSPEYLLCPCIRNWTTFAGPLWLGELHSQRMLESALKIYENASSEKYSSYKRLGRYFQALIAENGVKVPWFIDLHWLAKKVGIPLLPTSQIIDKLREGGYNASSTHFTGRGIKTSLQVKELAGLLQDKPK
ncbi:MAG TPA: hypothetical protein VJ044_09275 [Candidatus Hodarchaeales archaeon]|nr:hypothetical protein [Candidatus Hodarchaeales archaeon]